MRTVLRFSSPGAKHAFEKAEITYAELARRLKKHGFPEETEESIEQKLKRETFAATSLLACLRRLGLSGFNVDDLPD
jgi:hypothetical protein